MPQVTADSAVTLALDWVTQLFDQTKAKNLAPFLKLRDQQNLYDALADFFAPHFEKHLERFSNTPEREMVAKFSGLLVMQFLTQAFCGAYDDSYIFVSARYSRQVAMMLREKLNPFWEAREKQQQDAVKAEQAEILKQRAEKHASPDQDKETQAHLTAGEKVQVLRNSLAARNYIGAFDDKNQLHHQVVEYNNRTFEAAYQFFQANPDFTVAHLNAVLDKCLLLPKDPATQANGEGHDPLWHARKGREVAFLIQHLDKIVTALNCVDAVAPFQPVPAEQLFKKRTK